MHPFIQQHQSAITELCRRYRVQRLEVFGSAARGTDFAPEGSDADFLVEFAPSADSPTLKAFLGCKRICRKSWGAPLIWRKHPPCATPMSKPASTVAAKLSMQRDPHAYLWDAREAAAAILDFVAGKTFEDYAGIGCCVQLSSASSKSSARRLINSAKSSRNGLTASPMRLKLSRFIMC